MLLAMQVLIHHAYDNFTRKITEYNNILIPKKTLLKSLHIMPFHLGCH